MKKIISTLITLLFLNGSIGLVYSYAQSGCCKVRDDEGESWLPTDDSYSDCESKNESDRDDIYDPNGKVWWDLTC